MNKVNNTKAILFNGPKESGKDVALSQVGYRYGGCLMCVQGEYQIQVRKMECKDHLHTLVQNFFCVSEERYWGVYNNRDLKEKPLGDFRTTLDRLDNAKLYAVLGNEDFMAKTEERNPEYNDGWCTRPRLNPYTVNLTIREALIYVSEVMAKPRFGENYFGNVRASKVESNQLILDGSAAAFDVGGEIVCDEVPPLLDRIGEENCLLIRVHRPGYTFEGDSRRYITDGVVPNTVDVYNDGTLEEFFTKVENEVIKFLGE